MSLKEWKVSEEITFMSTNERIERLLKEHLYFMVYFLWCILCFERNNSAKQKRSGQFRSFIAWKI